MLDVVSPSRCAPSGTFRLPHMDGRLFCNQAGRVRFSWKALLGVWQNQELHPAFNRNNVGAIPTAPTFLCGSSVGRAVDC